MAKKNQENCEACGHISEFLSSIFREHTLCGSCIDRWKKLDAVMQNAGRKTATWGEMLQGLHPNVVLGKE